MLNDKTGVLTAAETSQIIKALTAGVGKPPTERELAIALKWAGLTAISSTFLSGVLRGDLTMTIPDHEPAFDITAKGIAVLQRRSNNRSSARDEIREQTKGSAEA
jgi:hypothetical protein